MRRCRSRDCFLNPPFSKPIQILKIPVRRVNRKMPIPMNFFNIHPPPSNHVGTVCYTRKTSFYERGSAAGTASTPRGSLSRAASRTARKGGSVLRRHHDLLRATCRKHVEHPEGLVGERPHRWVNSLGKRANLARVGHDDGSPAAVNATTEAGDVPASSLQNEECQGGGLKMFGDMQNVASSLETVKRSPLVAGGPPVRYQQGIINRY